jgi:hypothetical protein
MRLRLACLVLFASCPPAPSTGTDATGAPQGTATTSSTSSQPTTTTTGNEPTTSTGTTGTTGTTTGDASTSTTTGAASTTSVDCPVGALGCPCTGGGGCDPNLSCDAGTCVEGFSPPCVPDVLEDDCCGDGIVDALEECDEAYDNADDALCTSKCTDAVCGDGVVLENDEACDGGDLCTAECTFKSCGNGTVEPHEWCEPVRPDDPECTALCLDARKIVFITSTHYTGDLGGLAGADEKCQTHADSADLGGTFKAWLGVSKETEPASWLYPDLPQVTVDGDPVVKLCDGAALVDEFGDAHPGCAVMVGTHAKWAWFVDVWYESLDTCSGWTSDVELGTGVDIVVCSVVSNAPCSAAAPIICVEQ